MFFRFVFTTLFLISSTAWSAPKSLCPLIIDEAMTQGPARKLRILKPEKVIEEALLKTKTPSEAVDVILAQNLRMHVFQIKTLIQLYKDAPKDVLNSEARKRLIILWKQLKEFTEVTGFNSDAAHFEIDAVEMKVDPAVVKVLQSKREALRVEFEKFLDEKELLPSNPGTFEAIRKMAKDLNGIKGAVDRRFVLRSLISFIEEIRNTEFDMNIIEGEGGDNDRSVHKMRRKYREITLIFQALNGLIEFKKTGKASLYDDARVNHAEIEKYEAINRIGTQKNPIFISEDVYKGLVNLVFMLGLCKDNYQIEKELTESYVTAGIPSPVHEMMLKRPDYVEPIKTAKDIYEINQRLDILGHIIDELKAQI